MNKQKEKLLSAGLTILALILIIAIVSVFLPDRMEQEVVEEIVNVSVENVTEEEVLEINETIEVNVTQSNVTGNTTVVENVTI